MAVGLTRRSATPMCWKCDGIAPRCRIFTDPYWMEETKRGFTVQDDEWEQICQDLVWRHFPAPPKEASPEPPQAERQVAATRLVIIKPGMTTPTTFYRASVVGW